MTEYMAVWMVYDTIYHCKKVYDTMRHFVYDTKRGCNFFAKSAKIGCMTQKCMTQKYRPQIMPRKMIETTMRSVFQPLLLTMVVGNEALPKHDISEEKRHQKVTA